VPDQHTPDTWRPQMAPRKSQNQIRFRETVKGRFIKEEQAQANPRESIRDTMPKPKRPKKK
jgi:hypothetical protein